MPMTKRSSMGHNNRSMGHYSRSMTMSNSMSIGGDSFIGDISYIPTVCISHMVVDVLDPAVGEGHPVGARGGVAVSLLLLPEVGAAVVIGHSILVGVVGGLLMVATSSSSGEGLGHHAGDHQGEHNTSLILYIINYLLWL